MNGQSEMLLQGQNRYGVIAYRNGKPVSYSRFMDHVTKVYGRLPDARHAINLCEDRYHFLVVFAACVLRQQIVLFPPNRAKGEVDRLAARYPDSHRLDDGFLRFLEDPSEPLPAEASPDWSIPVEQPVAVVFTSGSTGEAVANPKSWGELITGARRVSERFGLGGADPWQIVATVPPQHMFGFETTIMLPLQSGVVIEAGRPFFPQDVADALAAISRPRLLVTTPLHLKVLDDSGIRWPAVDFVLSATAPLEVERAARIEDHCGGVAREIFGCSEAGAIATREPAREEAWHLLEGYSLESRGKETCLLRPGRDEPIRMADRFRLLDNRHFCVLGRDADMLNIAGKRGSLGDLNHRLHSLPGVQDGVFVLLAPSAPGREPRLAALAVAPGLGMATVLKQLAREVDEVFLPRPLRLVAALPYNETGKLPRADLLALLGIESEPAAATRQSFGGHA